MRTRSECSRKLAFLMGLLLTIGLVIPVGSVMGSVQSDIPTININGENRSLKDIVLEVAKQSGYRIEISESLLEKKVRGEFSDTDLETFFRRVLKGSNVFQVVDQESKVIVLYTTVREQNGRILVVEADGEGNVGNDWLDGMPGKTNRELFQERVEVFKDYDPAEHVLDGEPGKTSQDLLDERDAVFEQYDVNTAVLDGDPKKTTGDLLEERDRVFEDYTPSQHVLDGSTDGKTSQDLLDERDRQFENYKPNAQPLDGEPGRTMQDLLDERDRVFKGRKY